MGKESEGYDAHPQGHSEPTDWFYKQLGQAMAYWFIEGQNKISKRKAVTILEAGPSNCGTNSGGRQEKTDIRAQKAL